MLHTPLARFDFPETTIPEVRLFRAVLSAAVVDAIHASGPDSQGNQHRDVRALQDPVNVATLLSLALVDIEPAVFTSAVMAARENYHLHKATRVKKPRTRKSRKIKQEAPSITKADAAIVVSAVRSWPASQYPASYAVANAAETKVFLKHVAARIPLDIDLGQTELDLLPLPSVLTVLAACGHDRLAGKVAATYLPGYRNFYYARKTSPTLSSLPRPGKAVREVSAPVAELEPAE